MILNTKIFSAFCILLVATISTHAQTQTCFVRYSYHDIQKTAFSSYFQLGRFNIIRDDETVTKSFYHDESKVTVNVGVAFPPKTVGNKNSGLRLALAFTGKAEDVFGEVENAETSIIGRNPLKNSVMLSKSIKDEKLIWTFYLSCMPEESLPKWMRHAQQINGREAETATFSSACMLNFRLSLAGFRPRHLNRSMPRVC
ncbi:MAG TPA: hypothetical protein VK308_15220 [Pyrinomonadaceae bacterium]|nr:hypothetical protein [Pyrinomonadaceae bacterium]